MEERVKLLDKYDDYSDEELIRRIRSGTCDETGEMTDHLMQKYKPLVLKKSNQLFLIGGESEDLIQEGMIGLFKAVCDYREDRDASFFRFAQICINRQIYSALAASNRKKHSPLNTYVSLSEKKQEDDMDLEEKLVDHCTENPEKMFLEREFWEEFQKKLLDSLSSMERQVLSLYVDGNSYTRIAELMGKSPKSIDNALSRIRQKIGALKVGE